MYAERWLSGLLVILGAVITAWFLLAAQPEEAFVQSPDGVATLVGQGLLADSWQINAIGAPLTAPLAGYAYSLSPAGRQPRPVTLGLIAPGAKALYRLDPTLDIWFPVDEVAASEAGVQATIRDFALYAVGQPVTVTPPEFTSDEELMLAEQPPNTIGYDRLVATAQENGPYIVLPAKSQRYFCDGQAQAYKEELYSSRERLIEGQKYRLIFRWLIGGEPCVSGVLK
jgi:hypothetical protein